MRLMYLTTILIMVICCSACSNGNNYKTNANNESLETEVTSDMSTDDKLREIIKYEGSMDELLALYPTDYYSEFDNFYRVVYYGDYSVAVVVYDLEGNSFKRIYDINQTKDIYEDLEIGDSLDIVQDLDPKGDYSFLFAGRNDIPRVSTHYTVDKYVVVISYDMNNLITDINIQSL